jgi:anti-sigma factor RsiW
MSSLFHRWRFQRDHRWAPDRMSDFLDGDLGDGARRRIERHVGECAECRRVLRGLRGVLDALHRLPAPSGAPDALQIAAAVRLRLNEPPAR